VEEGLEQPGRFRRCRKGVSFVAVATASMAALAESLEVSGPDSMAGTNLFMALESFAAVAAIMSTVASFRTTGDAVVETIRRGFAGISQNRRGAGGVLEN
jgi:hypothetical protein